MSLEALRFEPEPQRMVFPDSSSPWRDMLYACVLERPYQPREWHVQVCGSRIEYIALVDVW